MNALIRSLIEKAGYGNGWENVRESDTERVVLFSARHKAVAVIRDASHGTGEWQVDFPDGPLPEELDRSFGALRAEEGGYRVRGEAELGRLLRRAAELAMALPNQAAERYAQVVQEIEQAGPSATDALRLSKQRVGQDIFRQALMEYWGGACAISGIALPALLRASHVKPWASCDSDAERLDVFNGFLLCAHYDALFDAGLISFTDEGEILLSNQLNHKIANQLGLYGDHDAKLRWISPHHQHYLTYHREHVFAK